MMEIILALNIAEIDQAQIILRNLSNKSLNHLYCEAVDMKKHYPLAYQRLDNEMTKRSSESIEKADSDWCKKLEVSN